MTIKSQNWTEAFRAFLDRRALIMFFLGFSAGIPILLIFSSLSLWLGEAGIDKSAVTFFSWAALGYSFKFVWAPLIDELPVPILTKILGRRRSWLFVAQIMIVCAICIMASSNPALGQSALIQMAVGAVMLGFSAATQDIVIDAYRIELAETNMQTVLASTYNAGYRLGMIIAGAGALFLASLLGTSKENYVYSAWQSTYFTMAAVMLVGIITTLVIREPVVKRIQRHYQKKDYFRLVAVFFAAILSFVLSYISMNTDALAKALDVHDSFLLFCFEAIRFIASGAIAVFVAIGLVKLGVVRREMAIETWVRPIQDFFTRYGLKLALFLLLLIGFYRISDIIAGVISNVFYQDLNFTKDEIAKAVKIYGVIFSLLGGFLGGLLAQRFNIMKLMFVGAVLASSTNLIFIGLVKSGQPLQPVVINVANKTYTTQPDDVGYFKLDVPNIHQTAIEIKTATASVSQPILYPHQAILFPINTNSVVVKGQVSQELINQKLELVVDQKTILIKPEKKGNFSVVIEPKTQDFKVELRTLSTLLAQTHSQKPSDLSIDVQPIKPSADHLEVQGKVIKSYSDSWLYFAIIVDNLASGLAGAAFIAFLSSLTSVSFTAVQYAIFSSLMTLTPKILGGYSGTIVTHIGYPKFFLMTTLLGIPILILIVWVAKLLKQHEKRA